MGARSKRMPPRFMPLAQIPRVICLSVCMWTDDYATTQKGEDILNDKMQSQNLSQKTGV